VTAAGAAAAIKSQIEGLQDLKDANWPGLKVTATVAGNTADKICVSTGATVVTVAVTSTLGNVNGIGVLDGTYHEQLGYVTLGFGNRRMNLTWDEPAGNGTLTECSNQGSCDIYTGTCRCAQQQSSKVTILQAETSNTKGGPGMREDCG
jgi:hypothetical protein